jgi:hypothetical protein
MGHGSTRRGEWPWLRENSVNQSCTPGGMFGSGQIAAFNPVNGEFLGLMKAPNDKTLAIDGLWALGFGAGNPNSGPYNTLFFTAVPNDESDGLFGTLVPISTELNEADEP